MAGTANVVTTTIEATHSITCSIMATGRPVSGHDGLCPASASVPVDYVVETIKALAVLV